MKYYASIPAAHFLECGEEFTVTVLSFDADAQSSEVVAGPVPLGVHAAQGRVAGLDFGERSEEAAARAAERALPGYGWQVASGWSWNAPDEMQADVTGPRAAIRQDDEEIREIQHLLRPISEGE